ncbi:sugar diacid recognition domain-containing protein [Vibrio taketomensis]|uniref:sugar diacid recognition domain-containing protein n=1 Tax=Vibrio taketomensis TaxID=2572923 RepID=UPI0013894D86|nr:sugar diacid recognition domain-containing protein [Vibrio taketomensis]
MQISDSIARQIVERTMKIIPYSVNVMDEFGHIIGSGEPSRLLQRHEGAILAITENRIVAIDASTAEHLKGVKPGINLPITHQDKTIGAIGISGDPKTVQPYGELVRMTAELIIEQAALMSQTEWQKRHKEELVVQLIQGANADSNQISSLALRLGVDLSQPRIAFVVKIDPRNNQTPISLNHLQQLVSILEQSSAGNLVGVLSVSQNEIVVLQPIKLSKSGWMVEKEHPRINALVKQIEQLIPCQIRIALGDYFAESDGLSKSYQTAKLTLNIAQGKQDKVFFYHDYRLPVLISDLNDGSWKTRQIRQPLDNLKAQDSKGVLFNTLQAYFAHHCDVHNTCQYLNIHRNTLRYRLERIEEISQLSVNNIEHLVHLYLAMQFHSH